MSDSSGVMPAETGALINPPEVAAAPAPASTEPPAMSVAEKAVTAAASADAEAKVAEPLLQIEIPEEPHRVTPDIIVREGFTGETLFRRRP